MTSNSEVVIPVMIFYLIFIFLIEVVKLFTTSIKIFFYDFKVVNFIFF